VIEAKIDIVSPKARPVSLAQAPIVSRTGLPLTEFIRMAFPSTGLKDCPERKQPNLVDLETEARTAIEPDLRALHNDSQTAM
jgi:hypothetical protein